MNNITNNSAPTHPVAGTDAWAVLQQLLCGHAAAADHLANTLHVEAHGCTAFGRTDAVDLFAARPLAFSNAALVLLSPQALAVIDDTADGRSIGAYADLVDGVIARLWVVGATEAYAAPAGATTAGATIEPAVAVARDDFMSQLRQRCQGDAADHADLRAAHWGHVVTLADAALDAAQTLQSFATLQQSSAASSSRVWVIRAFSSGETVAALLRLRLQTATLPRTAHNRLALAVAQVHDLGQSLGQSLGKNPGTSSVRSAHPQQRLAVSDALPNSAPVTF